jgi:hypothetical protein
VRSATTSAPPRRLDHAIVHFKLPDSAPPTISYIRASFKLSSDSLITYFI